MHAQAFEFVSRHATGERVQLLDIGGRNINGTVRPLFPAADYTALDIAPGEGVDIVADASTWTPDRSYDVVVCCEVFEHTDVWPGICATAHKALRAGGEFIVTTAGPGRAPHSAHDGGPLRPGEHYANIEPRVLRNVLDDCGFRQVVIDEELSSCDVRAHAWKAP